MAAKYLCVYINVCIMLLILFRTPGGSPLPPLHVIIHVHVIQTSGAVGYMHVHVLIKLCALK